MYFTDPECNTHVSKISPKKHGLTSNHAWQISYGNLMRDPAKFALLL